MQIYIYFFHFRYTEKFKIFIYWRYCFVLSFHQNSAHNFAVILVSNNDVTLWAAHYIKWILRKVAPRIGKQKLSVLLSFLFYIILLFQMLPFTKTTLLSWFGKLKAIFFFSISITGEFSIVISGQDSTEFFLFY